MSIDAVIVAYASEDVLGDALRLVGRLGGRTIVVDHGDGACARLAAGMGAVAIHDPSNPGFGTGQNRGVAFTESGFVLLCNPDAEIDPAAVLAGEALLLERPDVAAVEGVIVNRRTGRPERSSGVELGPVHLLGRALGARALLGLPFVAALARRSSTLRDHAERVPSGPVEVEWLAATAVLVRRSAFDDVGGFDESYFLYGEDLDLCHRLRLAGWKLLSVPDIWAVHESGGSAESAWARETAWWQGTMRFAAGSWSRCAWTVALFATLLRWGRLAARHPSHAGPSFTAMVSEPRARRAGVGQSTLSRSVRLGVAAQPAAPAGR